MIVFLDISVFLVLWIEIIALELLFSIIFFSNLLFSGKYELVDELA